MQERIQFLAVRHLLRATHPPRNLGPLRIPTLRATIGLGIAFGAIALHFAVWLHGT